MVTITATKANGAQVEKRVPEYRAADFVAMFTAYGYTNVSRSDEAPAAEVETVRTGRTTRSGKTVHKLVNGEAACGASYRRNRLNNSVQVTGEEVTCHNPACR